MPDLAGLIQTVGYIGLFAIVFAESGVLIGLFLPGDSLLFTAGIIASQGLLNPWITIAIVALGAILGDNFGYAFGRRVGPAIFTREDSRWFHKKHLERARAFYERHGGKTIVLARFIPIVRTFAPVLAGVGKMNYRIFLFYNIGGGLLWSVSLTLLGYYLGQAIPDIDRYILPIIGAIIFVSIVPNLWYLFRQKKSRRAAGSSG